MSGRTRSRKSRGALGLPDAMVNLPWALIGTVSAFSFLTVWCGIISIFVITTGTGVTLKDLKNPTDATFGTSLIANSADNKFNTFVDGLGTHPVLLDNQIKVNIDAEAGPGIGLTYTGTRMVISNTYTNTSGGSGTVTASGLATATGTNPTNIAVPIPSDATSGGASLISTGVANSWKRLFGSSYIQLVDTSTGITIVFNGTLLAAPTSAGTGISLIENSSSNIIRSITGTNGINATVSGGTITVDGTALQTATPTSTGTGLSVIYDAINRIFKSIQGINGISISEISGTLVIDGAGLSGSNITFNANVYPATVTGYAWARGDNMIKNFNPTPKFIVSTTNSTVDVDIDTNQTTTVYGYSGPGTPIAHGTNRIDNLQSSDGSLILSPDVGLLDINVDSTVATKVQAAPGGATALAVGTDTIKNLEAGNGIYFSVGTNAITIHANATSGGSNFVAGNGITFDAVSPGDPITINGFYVQEGPTGISPISTSNVASMGASIAWFRSERGKNDGAGKYFTWDMVFDLSVSNPATIVQIFYSSIYTVTGPLGFLLSPVTCYTTGAVFKPYTVTGNAMIDASGTLVNIILPPVGTTVTQRCVMQLSHWAY